MTSRTSAVLVLSMMTTLLVPPLFAQDMFAGNLAAVIITYVVGSIIAMIVIADLVALANDAERPREQSRRSVRRILSISYAVTAAAAVPLVIATRFDGAVAAAAGILGAFALALPTARILLRLAEMAGAVAPPPIPEGCDAYLPLAGFTAPRWFRLSQARCVRRFRTGEEIRVGDEHGNRAVGRVLGPLGNVHGSSPAVRGVLVELTSITQAEPAPAPASDGAAK
ncbi:hypothetical protein [Streptosporangium sp. NPDC002524]|uniref:hypothetical protein n=1 Tax=Streptosporangium sp. NPDC002524 TaxID=3154537 RepID=UPI003321EEF2